MKPALFSFSTFAGLFRSVASQAATLDSLGSTYSRTVRADAYFPPIAESGSTNGVGLLQFSPGLTAFNVGDDRIGAGIGYMASVDDSGSLSPLIVTGNSLVVSQIGRGAVPQVSDGLGSANGELGLAFTINAATAYTLTVSLSSEFVLSSGSGLNGSSAGFELRTLGGNQLVALQVLDIVSDGLADVSSYSGGGVLPAGSYALSATSGSMQELLSSTPPVDGFSRASFSFDFRLVPEPSTAGLLLVALGALALRHRG